LGHTHGKTLFTPPDSQRPNIHFLHLFKISMSGKCGGSRPPDVSSLINLPNPLVASPSVPGFSLRSLQAIYNKRRVSTVHGVIRKLTANTPLIHGSPSARHTHTHTHTHARTRAHTHTHTHQNAFPSHGDTHRPPSSLLWLVYVSLRSVNISGSYWWILVISTSWTRRSNRSVPLVERLHVQVHKLFAGCFACCLIPSAISIFWIVYISWISKFLFQKRQKKTRRS